MPELFIAAPKICPCYGLSFPCNLHFLLPRLLKEDAIMSTLTTAMQGCIPQSLSLHPLAMYHLGPALVTHPSWADFTQSAIGEDAVTCCHLFLPLM